MLPVLDEYGEMLLLLNYGRVDRGRAHIFEEVVMLDIELWRHHVHLQVYYEGYQDRMSS